MNRTLLKSPNRARERTTKPRSEQRVYDAIYDAIIDHRLPPGTRLTEIAFTEIFGVSRTIVRQALLRLAHENIIMLQPNRGAVVASPSVSETRAIFEARRIIESAVIPLLVKAGSKEEFNGLRALVKKEQQALERQDPRSYIKFSGEFHVRLAEVAGNSVLVNFLTELVSRTSLIIALYEAEGKAACAPETHLNLIEDLAHGDQKVAIARMVEHLKEIEGRLHLVDKAKAIDLAEIFRTHLQKSDKRKQP